MDLYFTGWKIKSNKMQAYICHSTRGHLICKKKIIFEYHLYLSYQLPSSHWNSSPILLSRISYSLFISYHHHALITQLRPSDGSPEWLHWCQLLIFHLTHLVHCYRYLMKEVKQLATNSHQDPKLHLDLSGTWQWFTQSILCSKFKRNTFMFCLCK